MFHLIKTISLCFVLLLQLSCVKSIPPVEVKDKFPQPLAPVSRLLSDQPAAKTFIIKNDGQLLEGKEHNLESLTTIESSGKIFPSTTQKNQQTVAPGTLNNNSVELNVDAPVSMSVENMPIVRFIHMIYGHYLKVNYVVDPSVEKKRDTVTIHMKESIKKSDLTGIVRELLAKYSVSVRTQNGITYLEPKRSRSTVYEEYGIFTGRELPDWLSDDTMILMLVPFNYVEARDYVNLLQTIQPATEGGFLQSERKKNGFYVKSRAGVVRKYLALVDLIDQPFLQDQDVKLLTLQYIGVTDFTDRIQEILEPLGVEVATAPGEKGVKMVGIPELSSVLLVSSNSEWLRTVQFWANKLDTASALGPEPKIFIYKAKHRTAESLSEVILKLRDGDGGGSTSSPSKKDEKTSNDNTSESSQKDKRKSTTVQTEQMSLTIDVEQNALVFLTSPQIYAELEKTLELLDVMARQVLVEIAIAEVTLTDKLQYGVEWYLKTKAGSDWAGKIGTEDGLGLGSIGLAGSITSPDNTFKAIINAFAEDKLVNILSNPKLVVLDNESATFTVGTDVPIITSESSESDLDEGSVLRNVQYRKTGVTVSVTPTIYSNGSLRLEIDQSISEAEKNDVSSIDSPMILDRSVKTSVTLQSGEYILIAGMISETTSEGEKKIPLLGDIPYLGELFKSTSNQTTRTELLIQVRPVILEDAIDARQQTDAFNRSLSDLQSLNDFFDSKTMNEPVVE